MTVWTYVDENRFRLLRWRLGSRLGNPIAVEEQGGTMSPQEARRIVDSLAHGVDPESGEVLSGVSPLCSAPVIRALFVASAALGDVDKVRPRPSAKRPAQAGAPWTVAEDAELAAAFDGGATVRELAGKHQRSAGGIRSRWIHLGRITEAPPIN
jgi:hypothetical protein